MRQTSAQGEVYWRVHVEAWRASGQSRAEYCAAHGLSRKTFGWWAWRLDRQGRPAPADTAAHFLPVEVADVCDPDQGGAAPVEARIEIALPDGVRVRVGRDVDGAALRRVLAALGR
jgi:transposase